MMTQLNTDCIMMIIGYLPIRQQMEIVFSNRELYFSYYEKLSPKNKNALRAPILYNLFDADDVVRLKQFATKKDLYTIQDYIIHNRYCKLKSYYNNVYCPHQTRRHLQSVDWTTHCIWNHEIKPITAYSMYPHNPNPPNIKSAIKLIEKHRSGIWQPMSEYIKDRLPAHTMEYLISQGAFKKNKPFLRKIGY